MLGETVPSMGSSHREGLIAKNTPDNHTARLVTDILSELSLTNINCLRLDF